MRLKVAIFIILMFSWSTSYEVYPIREDLIIEIGTTCLLVKLSFPCKD